MHKTSILQYVRYITNDRKGAMQMNDDKNSGKWGCGCACLCLFFIFVVPFLYTIFPMGAVHGMAILGLYGICNFFGLD